MVNLTPHDVTVCGVVYPASGQVARVTVESVAVGELNGVPIVRQVAGKVTGMQYDSDGKIVPCIVSGMVLSALPEGALGVYAPDTGPTAIRDERGQIVGVTRLICK